MLIGAILGAIVAGTSSPIVIPLASRLKNLQDKTKTALSIESIITDPLCIVVVLAAYYMIIVVGGGIDVSVGIKNLVSTFSVGAVVGAALGLCWLPVMHRVRKEQYSYVLTLAVVFLIYSLTESWWGGAGALSCLMFGLVLGNGKKVLKMIKYSGRGFEMDTETRQFHSLTSFVIRTFFFVYLGMVVSFQKIEFILIGVIVLLVLLLVRYLAIMLSTYRGGFERDDKQTMAVMMPRGLAAAILAINFGPAFVEKLMPGLDGFFKVSVFVVILGTAIVCTVGVSIIAHYEMKKLNNLENKHDEIDKTINKNSKSKQMKK
jgi:cell volume regulation protein A